MANGRSEEGGQRQPVIDKFLSPEAALTPGGAGLVVMMAASGISTLIRDINLLYVMVGLSFVVGALVFVQAGKLWHKLVYYLLNSLIIYCMALGAYANVTGKTLYPNAEQPPIQAATTQPGISVTTQKIPANAIEHAQEPGK